jgi:hypothetical protein
MLLSDDDPSLHFGSPAPDVTSATVDPAPARDLQIPPQAAPYRRALRDALGRYRGGSQLRDLEGAFVAAGGLVSTISERAPGDRPDLEELRHLALALPEFGELLSSAAGAAEQVVCAGTAGIWHMLGLSTAALSWTSTEREAARMVFACACVPAPLRDAARTQSGLRALAAGRFARLLCAELADSEDAWVRALGDRYDSVRHRCAPRTSRRSRGLSELLRADDAARHAVATRLERWMADGGVLPALAGELEAAVVHARTPAKFA